MSLTSMPLIKHARSIRNESLAKQILAGSDELRSQSEADLRTRAVELRWKVQTSRDPRQCKVEVCSLVREVSRRCYGYAHHPVQVRGALAMLDGHIAEMQTGEGKTLTALMPITLLALHGRGCHVLTANDYLACRDAEFASPVLQFFGLIGRSLEAEASPSDRSACYAADVTYGTEREFGFDYLRDQLSRQSGEGEIVQRELHVAVIDEADSILIDQARTPLIISVPRELSGPDRALYGWCHRFSRKLVPKVDYQYRKRHRDARLTAAGCRRVLFASKPSQVTAASLERLYHQIESSLVARYGFAHDRDYLVTDEQVEIIDHSTGRVLPGRKWQDGLQQAIEVAAGVELSDASGVAARITMQSYLRKYQTLCGMTGTATDVSSELRRVYRLGVTRLPTHRPCQRQCFPSRVFATQSQKFQAVAAATNTLIEQGLAVLVGTTSVANSELCADLLKDEGLEVRVLHARNHAEEAEIIESAGQPGRLTVATNMAGRGTDIKITAELAQAGGLHVLATEMNRSARIDRQLAGRCARQGDPGSYQLFVSLEDTLLEALGDRRVAKLKRRARRERGSELDRGYLSYFGQAQRMIEKQDARQRQSLLRGEVRTTQGLTRMGCDPIMDLQFDHQS